MAKNVKDAYSEILRLRNEFYQKWQEASQYDDNRGAYKAKHEAFDRALELLTPSIVDSQPEEPVNEELEEATKEWSENEDNVRGCDYISLVRVEEAFKAGANWQKDKLIKDAIEGYVDQVEYPGSTWIELSDTPKDLKDGDNVKLTIIKEDKV